MKSGAWIIIGIIIVAVIAAGVYYFTKAPEPSQSTVISIKNLAFNPANVSINAGEKVTWKNEDSFLHDVTMGNGLFDVDIEPGKSFTYTFNETGTYDYHCDIHPSMKGRIIVSVPDQSIDV